MMKKNIFFLSMSICLLSCNAQSISKKDRDRVIKELEYIKKVDQEYAGIPPQMFKNKYGEKNAWKIFLAKRDSISLDNQERIKKMFSKYGYLGFDKVGEEASNNFWISIQHADNDIEFQKQMLDEMRKEVVKNNVRRSDYALLEDRVNKNLGKKQRFGSQLDYNNLEQAVPKNGLVDSINIDKLRKEFDLEPYKDYLNRMTQNHYRMNEKLFLEKGIKFPKLYK
ncbi:hypothetical protein HHL23_10055 [Chryseobacterium sp. RP-3-3]|uniref:Uncharacterized protein n=1 Tax=Chryseobacterium antibioticum TaxID=2728847 RepID=A0A7Y0FRH6_9FLAO|nr:DUF6624 domain-containing protein [Chryseobacterium antibioticum]NML70138.1 hypothetical protein [Chryseobacterium antibioticum]